MKILIFFHSFTDAGFIKSNNSILYIVPPPLQNCMLCQSAETALIELILYFYIITFR